MNYYIFNYTNKDGEEKELKLRLTSADAMAIESEKKVKITEFLQEESLSMIITMLRYLNHWENKSFSINNAQQLYDELIDSGMTMKTVLTDIIYEGLVASGFLEKSDWEKMKRLLILQEEEKNKLLQQNI